MTEPNRQSGEKEERIIEIEIERLRPFKEHPFQVKDEKLHFRKQKIRMEMTFLPIMPIPIRQSIM